MNQIRLSPSKLSVLKECERCFFDINTLQISHPRTPFPTLPNGIDRVVKKYFDDHRERGALPKELEGDVFGSSLFRDQAQLKRWRHWQSGLTYEDSFPTKGVTVKLIGAIDDLLEDPHGQVSPLDYKTKGQPPKDSGAKYYQHQLDCYGLMLKSSGLELTGSAYLIYFWPDKAGTNTDRDFLSRSTSISFLSKVYKMDVDPGRAVDLIQRAVTVLTGDRPKPGLTCEHCRYYSDVNRINKETK